MKLLAPVKSSHEVASLVNAGADEFYCGLTPPGWEETFGLAWSSRRSPRSAGVPDLGDFKALLAETGGQPVSVALNAPYYPPGGAELLAEFGLELLELGAASLIVADMELLLILLEEAAGHDCMCRAWRRAITPSQHLSFATWVWPGSSCPGT